MGIPQFEWGLRALETPVLPDYTTFPFQIDVLGFEPRLSDTKTDAIPSYAIRLKIDRVFGNQTPLIKF